MVSPPAPTTRTSPVPKRTTPISSPSSPPSLTRGTSARSAVPPRVSVHARRASLKAVTPPPMQNGHDTKESLSASLKQEQEEKEQLLLKIQDRDQTITGLTAENANLTSALSAAEARVNELYEDQSRSEIELANRIDISEKLRTQIRELEKEKRDLQKRYNEQISTFDAERQALYDNEQHLKSRIQTLTQAKKAPIREVHPDESESEAEMEPQEQVTRPPLAERTNEPEQEPPEVAALRLELSTLSTSYASLHSTVLQMQTQLVELKRVNNELQEENESYMILLRERTLNGQFNPRRQVVGDDGDTDGDSGDAFSLRSQLERVEEEGDDVDEFKMPDDDTLEPSLRSRRQRSMSNSTMGSDDIPRGESLADLPISGPGLDLAAELGRAENMDILDPDEKPTKTKRSKKPSLDQSTSTGGLTNAIEVDTLRSEVKALKDANKALSLYASRIIDRIIAEEGFERVLAVDYDKSPNPADAAPGTTTSPNKSPPPPKAGTASGGSKPRPQSVIVGRSASNPAESSGVQSPPPTTSRSSSASAGGSVGTTASKVAASSSSSSTKAQRRSLSVDWSRFSIFGKTPDPTPNLKPLTLTPGAASVTSGARKLDTEEDDEDRKERERLHATMKLMGIQTPTPPLQVLERNASSANSSPKMPQPATPLTATANKRFSFFSRSSSTASVQPTTNGVGLGINQPANLTEDALVRAEAENTLAALDAHERSLSNELSKGSAGTFTEIQPRSGRRSRRSGDSRSESNRSGSTVFSAGLDGE